MKLAILFFFTFMISGCMTDEEFRSYEARKAESARAASEAYFQNLRNRCAQYGHKEGTSVFANCVQNEARVQEAHDREAADVRREKDRRLSCYAGNKNDCDNKPQRTTNCTKDYFGNVQCVTR